MATVRMVFGKTLEVRVSLRSATPSVEALLEAIPFKSSIHRWGDEVYFDAPFHCDIEADARARMEVGDVAFWPNGDAIAVFFGPTPASVDEQPMAYSPCNILGRVDGPAERLKSVGEGARVEILSV